MIIINVILLKSCTHINTALGKNCFFHKTYFGMHLVTYHQTSRYTDVMIHFIEVESKSNFYFHSH